MLEVIRYSPDKKTEWDDFVRESDNFSFLFYRDYIEYHSGRFDDYSLMFYDKNKLKSLFPGNIIKNNFYSHQGLTFGGIIHQNKFNYKIAVQCLDAYINHLGSEGLGSVVIKQQPFFYSQSQQQVIQFHLEHNLKIIPKYDIGVFIYTPNHIFPNKCVRKGKLNDYKSLFSEEIDEFWEILENNLALIYDAKPVHSLKEIKYLKSLFPDNIKLLLIKHLNTTLIHAGAVLYEQNNIVKVQYFATTPEGRKNRASDVLYYSIINYYKHSHNYIDFGTNMDRDGNINTSLIETKEKFGASIYKNNHYVYTISK